MPKVLLCINCAADYPSDYCLWLPEGKPCKDLEEESTEVLTLSFDLEETVEPKEMKDPVSTGRKRAAVMYPIKPGQVCEWAFRKNCGGGPIRIIGCAGRPAVNLHHGIDKSTLNNDRENMSIICTYCHNRFHAANDKFWVEPRPKDNGTWLPDPVLIEKFGGGPVGALSEMVKATKQEILMNEMMIPEGGKDVR
jgi:hypothetical protein